MKHRSKQLLSVLLSLCMVLSLFAGTAVTAYAADDGAALDLKNISETNKQGANYTNGIYTKIVKNGSWTWDPTNKILTLNNCDIKPMDESETPLNINGIEFPDGDVKLVLNGGNYISTPGNYAICGGDNLTLTISGDGWLETQAKSAHIRCGNLVLQSGSVILQAGQVENAGIWVTNLTVNGGTLSAMNFKARAILAGTAVTINGGRVTASVEGGTAIAGTNNITVNSEATIEGGESAASKQPIESVGSEKYLEITVPAPAAATFADGFGSSVADADTYVKGQTTNDKGYAFDGWVGSDGSIVDSADKATPGVSYTARWTMNGKLVRTAPLDLSGQTEFLEDIAEGWSWNAETKTLTLNGCTIDVKLDTMEGFAAITLPDGATVTSVKGSKNVVTNNSEVDTGMGQYIGIGIAGDGKLTVAGEGEFSVTGGELGLFSMGDLAINAPISVTATDTGEGNIYAILAGSAEAPAKIIIASSLSINTPENGKVVTGFHGQYIAESDGDTAALRVVIGSATQPGGNDKPAEKPAVPKTSDAGVALYIGIAAVAVLACGAVIAVAHKRKEN